jgi:archaetidylinositol phosphate synthase
MLAKLKSRFQKLVAGLAKTLYRVGLKPNAVSGIGLVLGLLSGATYWSAGLSYADISLYRACLALATALLLLSSLCDALDGAMARLYGEVTAFGGLLDSIVDRYVESAVLLGIIVGGLCAPLWGLLALTGSLLTSYVRARAEAMGVAMESVGLFERAERLLIILASSIAEIAWPRLSALELGIAILAVASNFTVLQRALYLYRKVQGMKEG